MTDAQTTAFCSAFVVMFFAYAGFRFIGGDEWIQRWWTQRRHRREDA